MEQYIFKYLVAVRPKGVAVVYLKDGRTCEGKIEEYNGDAVIVSPHITRNGGFRPASNRQGIDIVKLTDLVSCSRIQTPRELMQMFYTGPLQNDHLPKGLIVKGECAYGRIEAANDEHGYEYIVAIGKWDFDTAGFILTGEKRVWHLPYARAYDAAFEERLIRDRRSLVNNTLPFVKEEELRRGKRRYRKNDLIRFSNENVAAVDLFNASGITEYTGEEHLWFYGVITGIADQGLVVRELIKFEMTSRWYPDAVGKTIYEEMRQNFATETKIVSYRNLPMPGVGRLGFLDSRGLWLIKHHPREWNGYTDRY